MRNGPHRCLTRDCTSASRFWYIFWTPSTSWRNFGRHLMVSIRILFKMRTNNPSIPKGPQWLQKKKLTLYDSARIGSAQAVLLFEIVCLSVIIAASYLLPDPYGSKRLIPCLVGSSSAVHKPHLSLSPEAPSVSPPRTRDLATIYVALQEYRHVTTPPGRPQVPSSSLLECSWGPCP